MKNYRLELIFPSKICLHFLPRGRLFDDSAGGIDFLKFTCYKLVLVKDFTCHSSYDATSTESNGVEIDGFLYPNYM